MIKIYSVLNRSEAEVLKSYLEGHGIPTEIRSDDLGGLLATGILGSGMHLYVDESQAEDAIALIEDANHPPTP